LKQESTPDNDKTHLSHLAKVEVVTASKLKKDTNNMDDFL
jgi:hypothetical protein